METRRKDVKNLLTSSKGPMPIAGYVTEELKKCTAEDY